MSHLAFIFARGGSKGLPGKNIKPLLGKPLIQYAIESAYNAPSIDNVFVSTDDADIAAVASALDAIIIERPAALAQDHSSEWLAWRHAIQWVNERYGHFDHFVSLPTTSPLRSVDDIEQAIAKQRQTAADVCVSVTPSSRSPYFNMVTIGDDRCVKLVNTSPDGLVYRRQDVPEVFDMTTVVYVTTPEFIENHSSLFEGRVTSIEVPKARAVDIDDIYDFMLAESILKQGNL